MNEWKFIGIKCSVCVSNLVATREVKAKARCSRPENTEDVSRTIKTLTIICKDKSYGARKRIRSDM